MNVGPARPVEPSETQKSPVEPPTGHLVVKRGHRGRYRLTLMTEGVRIKGDLTVGDVDQATSAADGRALALFARAAASLVASIATARVKP